MAKLKEEMLPLVTPGEILAEEYLRPLDVTEHRLAEDIKVDPQCIHEIVCGISAVTPDMALRLSLYFGTTPQFWLNLQMDYELRRIVREKGLPKVKRFRFPKAG